MCCLYKLPYVDYINANKSRYIRYVFNSPMDTFNFILY